MKIDRIVVYHKNGSLHTVDDPAGILAIIKAMPPKLLWKHTADISSIQGLYFRMLTQMARDLNTGDTKTDLHAALKPLLMTKFKDFPNYFSDGIYTNSTTRTLTYDGWVALVEQLKDVANTIFKYTFNTFK
jgi:hypothetical protein